jgi:adenylate cyclase class 2
MQYEVEQKYRLDDPPRIEATRIEAALAALAVVWQAPQRQVDTYYAHPSRDFAQTDEALRIRRIEFQGFVTYKGPKVGQLAKTRKELEMPIAGGAIGADQFAELLEALGFRRVADVPKVRRPGELVWNGSPVSVALDDVAQIGRFLEIELLADDAHRAAAEQTLQSLAAELGLSQQERRSYLGLVLERRKQSP